MLNTAQPSKRMVSIRNKSAIHRTAYMISREINRGQAILDKIETVLTQIHSETGLRNLAKIDAPIIDQYITYLYEKVENDELSKVTAANYISALNTALSYADHDDLAVSAKSLGLSRGSFTPADRSVPENVHNAFLKHLQSNKENTQSAALAKSVQLQRSFGLRFRESVMIKDRAIKSAIETGILRIGKQDGTKNARPRTIPVISENQKNLLRKTYDFMRANGQHSLIDSSKSYREYKSAAYNTLQEFRNETGESFHFHGERHAYAHARYSSLWQEKTGTLIKPPVLIESDWREYVAAETELPTKEIQEIETNVRQEVSYELGHNRLSITHAYLG